MVDLVDYPPMNPKPLNGQQFSQGTLWDPRSMKPTKPEDRWPHGYSPERRDEISAALPAKIGVSSAFAFPGGGVKGDPHSGGVFPSIVQAGGKRKNQVEATRNALVDILSRSTVPVEDIARNTPEIKIQPMARASGQMMVRYNVQTEQPVQGRLKVDPGGGPERSRAKVEHTVIHEFGHHADYESDPASYVRSSRYEGIAPAEGFAEGYAAKHRVPRRNEPPSPYSDVAAYQSLHRRPAFGYHFERASGQPLSEAMGNKPAHLGEQFEQPSLFDPPEISSAEWEHLTKRATRPQTAAEIFGKSA